MDVVIMKHLDSKLKLKLLSQGNTAEIYTYGDEKILKLFRDFMPIEPIKKEYNISKSIQPELSNVPRTYEFVMYKERYGIIYEKIEGTDLIALMLRNVFKIPKYSKYMALVHSRMHEIQIDVDYTLKDKLKDDLERVQELTENEKQRILSYLADLPDGDRLCHFDFHPGNMMMRDDNAIIIDWMTACTGNPNADVARTKLMLNYGEMRNANFIMSAFIRLFERVIGSIYLKEYRKITGTTMSDIDKWLLPVAAARLSESLTEHERAKLVEYVRDKLDSLEGHQKKE